MGTIMNEEPKLISTFAGTPWEGLAEAWRAVHPGQKVPGVMLRDDVMYFGPIGAVRYFDFGPEHFDTDEEMALAGDKVGAEGAGYYANGDDGHQGEFIGGDIEDLMTYQPDED